MKQKGLNDFSKDDKLNELLNKVSEELEGINDPLDAYFQADFVSQYDISEDFDV